MSCSKGEFISFSYWEDDPIWIAFGKPIHASVVKNAGRGDCGYLAFAQWLNTEKKILRSARDLRNDVSNFDETSCMKNGRSLTNLKDAKIRARRGKWMQNEELAILSCIYNVCVIVYRVFNAKTTSEKATFEIVDANDFYDASKMNNKCKDVMFLYNTGQQHFELLFDIIYLDKRMNRKRKKKNTGSSSQSKKKKPVVIDLTKNKKPVIDLTSETSNVKIKF